ncbi:hypothetical protein GS921_24295 [Rhodococcus hoagii]|nr:hypothetical protein [Prescottella equi]NKV32829.1 hypothetical protein [Prescottella equi]
MTGPPPVTMYGREACPPCKRTKKLLKQAGADLLYVDVDLDLAALDELDLRWCGYWPGYIKTVIDKSPADKQNENSVDTPIQ